MRYASLTFASIGGFIVLILILGSWYTIDERERGVILRNGAIIGVAEPGLHFKIPVIDDVVKLSLETKILSLDKVAAYSRDQQTADMRVSVNYRLVPDQVRQIYTNYGSEEGVANRIIRPRVFEQTKTVFGQFNAVTSIQDRGRLNIEVQRAVAESVQGPVVIEGLQIENIDFSDAYENSIEQRMLAEVEVQKIRQNADREKVQAEIVITQANAKASAVRAAAEAEADAIKLRGDAEASAIRARGDAVKDNPGLIPLTTAERWDGKLPTTMLPDSVLPFITTTQRP